MTTPSSPIPPRDCGCDVGLCTGGPGHRVARDTPQPAEALTPDEEAEVRVLLREVRPYPNGDWFDRAGRLLAALDAARARLTDVERDLEMALAAVEHEQAARGKAEQERDEANEALAACQAQAAGRIRTLAERAERAEWARDKARGHADGWRRENNATHEALTQVWRRAAQAEAALDAMRRERDQWREATEEAATLSVCSLLPPLEEVKSGVAARVYAVLARASAAEAALAAERARVCSACAGTGTPLSGRPCICGGAGTEAAEILGLRHARSDAQRDRDQAEAALAAERARGAALAGALAVYIHAHDSGNAVPPYLVAEARQALAAQAAQAPDPAGVWAYVQHRVACAATEPPWGRACTCGLAEALAARGTEGVVGAGGDLAQALGELLDREAPCRCTDPSAPTCWHVALGRVLRDAGA